MMKRSFLTLAFLTLSLSACDLPTAAEADIAAECKDVQPDEIAVQDILGKYAMGDGSFAVPIDPDTGAQLEAKRIDLSGEVITVTAGAGGALELESDTLGEFVAQPAVVGQAVALQMVDQIYAGALTSAAETLRLRGIQPLVFEKTTGEIPRGIRDAGLEITFRPVDPGLGFSAALTDIEGTDRNKYYISMKKGPGLR